MKSAFLEWPEPGDQEGAQDPEDEVERLAQIIVSMRNWPITLQDDEGDGEWSSLHETKACQILH